MRTFVILACLALAVQGFPGHHGKRSRAIQQFLDKKPFIHGRIVGGEEAEKGSIPYIVSLQYFNFHFCGGSVYNEEFIVTAAHCVSPSEDEGITKVVAAEFDVAVDEGDEQSITVMKVLKNPSYRPSTFDSDVALLKLESALRLGEGTNVSSIPLDVDDYPLAGSSLKVSGWGTLSSGGSSPDTLQTVNVPTVSKDDCNRAYDGDITETMVCAGEEGRDSCQGDSGGPLTKINADGNEVLVGIVSWGRGCALRGYPGVYSRVTALGEWIEKTVEENSRRSN